MWGDDAKLQRRMSELRFHPFLRQWVITATHRQDRTFLPPADFCPLCPTRPGATPTEIPFESYDIVVFENKFPSLAIPSPTPAIVGSPVSGVRAAEGICEVVCYSDQHDASLATLPLSQVKKLVRVWKDRYLELGRRNEVAYILIFENKGKELGVTLEHPHGQIYAFPFIPPTAEAEIRSERDYFLEHGRHLMAAVLEEEVGKGEQAIFENDSAVAFIPSFARYPYETYVTTKSHRASLAEMSDTDLDDFAEAIHVTARKLDGLFGFSMPYLFAIHQKPTIACPEGSWIHAEFYPPYRTATKLKYLAGCESGGGTFINDTLAEETAARLRSVTLPE